MSESKSLPRKLPFRYYDQDDNEVIHEVRKLPLGKASELSRAFKELPSAIKGLMEGEETKVLFAEESQDLDLVDMAVLIANNLGSLLEVAQDAIIEILQVGSGLERQAIENLGLDEAAELFLLIVKVNNLSAMQANLKNALSLLSPNWAQRAQKTLAAVNPKKSGSKIQ
jgi:hypothetical protein